MKKKKQRKYGAILLALSLFVTIFSWMLMAGASLPYPDPTLELLMTQENHIRILSYFMKIGIFGVALSTIGFVFSILSKIWRR